MNRIIKFRCWFAGKMYYGIPAIMFNKDGIRVVNLNHDNEDFCNTPDTWTGYDDYALMQFTGLHDKNKTPIYEGDRIRYSFLKVNASTIIDDYGEITVESIFQYDVMDAIKRADELKVIGNIYEHPNLLNP